MLPIISKEVLSCKKTYSRGDMYYANLGKGVGSEQEGYRPVVIIQNNVGNRFSPTVIVAAITSKVGVKPRLPTHYFIDSEDGLELPSVILMEQLRTIDKHRLGKYIGHLKPHHIEGMNRALAVSINLRYPRTIGQTAVHIVEAREVSATET